MDPFRNGGKRRTFFNSFIDIAPFEKRSTANVLGQKYYKKIDEGVDIDLVVCYTTIVKPKTAGFCKSIPLSCRGESSVFICAFHMFKAL